MTKGRGSSRRGVRISKTLIILACCAAHSTLEAKAAPAISEAGALDYLSQFGYLAPVNPKSQAIMSQETLSEAISDFQSFVGINVTGDMDVETAHMMTLPRCGVKDKVGISITGRSRRWAAFGSPWSVKSLTYKISKYPRRLDKATVDREMAKALGVWSKYTDLTFSPSSGEVDIEISFVVGHHGDNNPFNGAATYGQPNVLAHAFSPGPGMGGDAHFDDEDEWTVDSYDGVNLFQVAAHEFGHSLGLDHSRIASALMAPVYRSYEPNFELHTDDISGIQALYGPKTTGRGYGHQTQDEDLPDPQTEDEEYEKKTEDEGHERQTNDDKYVTDDETEDEKYDADDETEDEDYEHGPGDEDSYEDGETAEDEDDEYDYQTEDDEASDLCRDPQIDTIFTTTEGYTYVFKGNHYWRLTTRGIAPGHPEMIATGWKGLPGNIDAAFTYNGRTYFFKGSQYWSFTDGQMDDNYPRNIGNDFPGIPDDIDAATVGSRDGQMYFYKGSKYWRFNPDQRLSPVRRVTPRHISDWQGLPENVDAAFSHNGDTYFFKGGAHYRYDESTFAMDPASPLETGSTWFGCQFMRNDVPWGGLWRAF